MKEPRFFICKHCGNLITKLQDSGARVVCCGEEMVELDANTEDGAREKHLPVVKDVNGKIHVEVGEVIHPMTEAHYIQWIYVQTANGGQFKYLQPGDAPICDFSFVDDEVIAVYEYCNLHGLYKTMVKA
jgi:superoxide reductase